MNTREKLLERIEKYEKALTSYNYSRQEYRDIDLYTLRELRRIRDSSKD